MALVGAALLVAGCTGKGAVDVNNGGEFRFVAGTPAGEVIPVKDRQSAPDFSGTLLDGTRFSSSSLSGDVERGNLPIIDLPLSACVISTVLHRPASIAAAA